MKLVSIFLLGLLMLTGYATEPRTPVSLEVGMANPASVYCEQKGGSLIAVQTSQGVKSDHELPDREVADEWSLWHGDHPATVK